MDSWVLHAQDEFHEWELAVKKEAGMLGSSDHIPFKRDVLPFSQRRKSHLPSWRFPD
jgi:hypothetical protein